MLLVDTTTATRGTRDKQALLFGTLLDDHSLSRECVVALSFRLPKNKKKPVTKDYQARWYCILYGGGEAQGQAKRVAKAIFFSIFFRGSYMVQVYVYAKVSMLLIASNDDTWWYFSLVHPGLHPSIALARGANELGLYGEEHIHTVRI